MKALGAVLLVAVVGLSWSTSIAAEQPNMAARINNIINQTHISGQFSSMSKDLGERGYIARWQEAIIGEGKIIDDQGSIQTLKIFTVPFADPSGDVRSSIIGGIIISDDGNRMHDFIHIAPIGTPDHTSAIALDARDIHAIDIKPMIESISAGNRSEIWDFIIANIPSHDDSGISVRAALEKNGFLCSPAPAWFHPKSIWYGATCINSR